MKTAPSKSDCITDVPIVGKKHTLYPAALGHRSWLIKRKNKTILKGSLDDDSVMEVCFAYTHEPEALQSITGEKATRAIRKFSLTLEEPELARILEHVGNEFAKAQRAMVIPKKKPEPLRQPRKKPTRAAKL